jgi:hypothetical protein
MSTTSSSGCSAARRIAADRHARGDGGNSPGNCCTGRRHDGNSDSPAISAEGRFVAFNSDATNLVPGDTNGFTDVLVRFLAP